MKTTQIRRPAAIRGISTAEILFGTLVSFLVLGGMYSFQVAQAKALAAQSTYNDSQNVTRTVIDLMTRELRMSSYDPTGLALSTSVTPASCPGVKQGLTEGLIDKIHFKQDLDGNGNTTGTGEDIIYDMSGSDLRRTDGPYLPVQIVSGVPAGGFYIRYFDNSNPPVELVPTGSPPQLSANQRNCVAKVRITVKASLPNPDPKNPNPIKSMAESEVAIRNRSLINF